ncbi:MAG: ATP-binding cassette domain-containing protein, partial [Armatimonadota bacterium]
MSDPLVYQLDQVSFAYGGGAPALDQITLDLSRGESLALLGANACGKSTLLALLAGLQFPTSGSLSAFGAQLTEAALEHPETAYAFRRR